MLDKQRREPIIVVVSAFQGVTNQLLECARLAERGDAGVRAAAAGDRAPAPVGGRRGWSGAAAARCASRVDALLAELRDTLHGIHLLRHCPLQALDMTASFGERLSALIIAAHLNQLASRDASSTRGSS